MTIDATNNNPRIRYSVSEGASQTNFTVPFEFFDDSDLYVYVDGIIKTITTDYTVTGGDGSTGDISFVSPVVGATGGSIVVITRNIPIERVTDFVTGVDISRAALNTQLDTLTALIADVNDTGSRSIRLADTDASASLTIPSAADRANGFLSFDSNGNIAVNAIVNLDFLDLERLDIDNIRIDGNTVSSLAGNITLDSFGDITLDHASLGSIYFSRAGTAFGEIYGRGASSELRFYGDDSGTLITLTAEHVTASSTIARLKTDNAALYLDTDSGGLIYLQANSDVIKLDVATANNLKISTDASNEVFILNNSGLTIDGSITSTYGYFTDIYSSSLRTSVGVAWLSRGNDYVQFKSGASSSDYAQLNFDNVSSDIIKLKSFNGNDLHLDAENVVSLLYNGGVKLSTKTDGVTVTGDVGATTGTFTGDVSAVNATLTGYLRGPATFTIDPATHGDNTGTVVIAGNLQVDGTTTTINSTTLTVDDANIVVASGAANAAAADGAGLTIDGANITFTYDDSDGRMELNKELFVYGNSTNGEASFVSISNSDTGGDDVRIQGTNPTYTNYDTTVPTSGVSQYIGGHNFLGRLTSSSYHTYGAIRPYIVEGLDSNTTGKKGGLHFGVSDGSSSAVTNIILKVEPDGVDVTGTVTADGLTLDNNGSIQFNDPQATDTVLIGTNDNELILRTDDGDIALKTNENKQQLRVANNGDISFYENTGTTAKLTWSASDELLTTTEVKIYDGSNLPLLRFQQDAAATQAASKLVIGTEDFSVNQLARASDTAYIMADEGSIRFDTASGNSSAAFIFENGNVGIGTSSPSASIHAYHATTNVVGTFESGDANAYITLADNTTSSDTAMRIGVTGNNMHFSTSASERLRIDSNGNLLVGKTNTSFGTEGQELRASGQTLFTRDGNEVLSLNRKTSNGDIVGFYKDSATVGSIASKDGDIAIGTGGVGLRFGQNNSDQITPHSMSTNSGKDASLTLGSSGARFKDLYLSGNITGPSQVTRDINTSSLALAGGTDSNVGANILLYGGSHASLAGVTRFRNGSAESMVISSLGRVGIGTSDPQGNLQISSSSSPVLKLTGGSTGTPQIHFGDLDSDIGMIEYKNSNDSMQFTTAGSGRVTIDSSGNVGIGTSSPSYTLSVEKDVDTWVSRLYNTGSDANAQGVLIRTDATAAHDAVALGVFADSAYKMVVKSTGNVGIGTSNPQLGSAWNKVLHIHSSSGTGSHIRFTDPTSGLTGESGLYIGQYGVDSYIINRESGKMLFVNSGSEAMRIDSNQNLLVGHTGSVYNNVNSTSTEGISLTENGEIFACSSQSSGVMILNRKSTNGTILTFDKDGSTMGSIDTFYANIMIGRESGARLGFGATKVYSANNSGSTVDAAYGLGSSTSRFTDLYLSGGVYLGGTGSANKLDDYEEGTWTPVASTGTISYSRNWYTKIGRLVTVNARIYNFSNRTSTANVGIGGLPFSSDTGVSATGSMIAANVNDGPYAPYISSSTNTAFFYTQSALGYHTLKYNDFNNSASEFHFTLTYIV